MFGNLDALLRLRKSWDTFCGAHPGVAGFIRELGERDVCEGSVIEIRLSYPDGTELSTNMRVGAEDIELLGELKAMAAGRK